VERFLSAVTYDFLACMVARAVQLGNMAIDKLVLDWLNSTIGMG
jgi:hypothetical protein